MINENPANTCSICDLDRHQLAIVVAITASCKAAKRLADLGLTPNTTVKILRKTIFCGPMEIQVRGSKLILGNGVTTKIIVKKI